MNRPAKLSTVKVLLSLTVVLVFFSLENPRSIIHLEAKQKPRIPSRPPPGWSKSVDRMRRGMSYYVSWITQNSSTVDNYRTVLAAMRAYPDEEAGAAWISCLSRHNFSTQHQTLRMQNIRILIIGNSWLRQVAESIMNAIPQEDIDSLQYIYFRAKEKLLMMRYRNQTAPQFGTCPCSFERRDEYNGKRQARHHFSCPFVALYNRSGGLKVANVSPQSPFMCDGQALDTSKSGPRPYCIDDVGLLKLRNGGLIAQLTNANLDVNSVHEFVHSVFNMSLSNFDLIIANEGNAYDWRYKVCGKRGVAQEYWEDLKTKNQTGSHLYGAVEFISLLRRAGFGGKLLYTASNWNEVLAPHVLHDKWGSIADESGIRAEYFDTRLSSHDATVACGFSAPDGVHSSFPGPHMFLPNVLEERIKTYFSDPGNSRGVFVVQTPAVSKF